MFLFRKPEPSGKGKADLITEITGEFGKYQLWLCFIVFISKIFIAFNQLAIIFYAPPVQYTCGTKAKNTCPCAKPEFDTSIFTRTIITEWNLICDKKWQAGILTQTIFQAGTLFGSLGFGMASDKYGRRLPFLAACLIQFIFGIGGAYLTNFWLFILFRFIVGLSVGGTMVVGFVIIMEFIGPTYREVVSALYQVPFNLGCILSALVSYYLRDFRDYQLGISVPSAIFIIYIYSLPETPRWLIAKNRTEEALRYLTHTAKMNNRPTENIRANVEAFQVIAARHKLRAGTTVDLFRTPNLRKNILAMAYNWLMCSYCFYGVSQFVGQLAGNIFTNIAVTNVIVTLGTLSSIPLLKLFGRKTILLGCHFVCTACLVMLAFSEGTLAVICASIGVVSSFIVFVVVYLYCGELFPTVVRNAAVGFCSMIGRVGSMVAPAVINTKDIRPWLPPMMFAVVPFFAFFVTMLLPETKGCELTTTLEEGENFGKKPK